jgi:hypothetical protein
MRKSKNNTRVDVDAVVQKLKSLYRKYAEVFGPKIFNLEAFEQRYRDALVNKINLTNFCHAEITVFEELKKKVETKSAPREKARYSDVADRIIEENLQKIRRYRLIDFHPDAEEETKYLLGVMTDFYYEMWGQVKGALKSLGDRSFNEFMEKLENDFGYYVVPMRGLYSRAADDYMLVLARKNPKDSERASYNFMKYGAILLNNCLKLIADAINLVGTKPEHAENVETLQRIRQFLGKILADFRLSEIREY